ncbi:DNA polymerase-3 subunit gamma/tau [Knoellia remsis]|uniref:DNA-directed DNA polymerase n=1 Tax=Knoellia remsis TaxID=407159 RepID=A0A2T0UNE2_9MICO|nr:DNA polymerase III subunit gamma and tau [Knoellia remsis]PRY59442.1 DNA polymerase-3 subunit gamma/tau [Knoellia remsis]
MSTALYRRYRPETFADVIGQEHVTEPLMQALRTGRVNHAYLFSGPRGCGKTTSARILARCLNCEQGPTDTPCGTCDSCVALARGGPGSVDVIEIDAASHGGVDDARDLRERASYGPAQSRYKVYIIDEAHMVTPQGFNALLKIVEEPPEHVKFVFATTEPEKVIGTIRSRTHHYPFRLVPPGQLTDYMERLCAAEGVTVAPGVLSFVVRAGGGSVRDSLSVLDQLIAGSGDEGLTYESAASLLGFTDGELLDAAIDAFGAGDGAGAFAAIERVIESGLDPRRFIEDLLERLRDLIVVAAVPDGASAVLRALPPDQLERMRQQAAAFGPGALSRAADVVNAGLTEMTGATAPRLQLELIAARLLLPGAAGESGYAARLDRLERRLDVGGVPSGGGMPAAVAGGPRTASSPTPTPQPSPSPQPAPSPTRAPQGQAGAGQPAPTPTSPGPDQAGRPVPPQEPPSERPDPQPDAQPGAQPAQNPGPGQQPQSGPDGPQFVEPVPTQAPSGRDEDPAADAPAQTETVAAQSSSPQPSPAHGGLDTAAIRRSWPDILAKVFELRRTTWTFVSEHAQVLDYNGERLLLGIATTGLANTFRRGPHATYVQQALIDVLGVDVRVEGVPADGSSVDTGGSGVAPIDPSRPDPAPAAPARGGGGNPPARRPGPGASGNGAANGAGGGGQGGPGEGAPAAGGAMVEPVTPPDTHRDGPGAAHHGGPTETRERPAYDSSPGTRQAEWGSDSDDGAEAPAWATAQPDEEPPVSPYARAREAVASEPDPDETPLADDSAISDDDEDIEGLGEVGVPVVERVLGGKVIHEEDA